MKKFLLIFTFLISTLTAFSQISGTVTDSTSNEPVIGVLVLIQGEAGKGATTDSNGKFELKGLDKPTYTLEFRYMGYHSQFIKASSKDTLNIKQIKNPYIYNMQRIHLYTRISQTYKCVYYILSPLLKNYVYIVNTILVHNYAYSAFLLINMECVNN